LAGFILKGRPLHFLRVAFAAAVLAFSFAPDGEAAPQPAAASASTAEAKAIEAVGRIRQLAVEIERQTAPREVERRKFNELKTFIDGEAMAQFVLVEHLAAASAAQRSAAVAAISDLVADGLIERLGGAHAEPFELGEARTLDNGDIVVVSHVRFRDGHRGELDWRLHAKGSGHAMIDVLVDGVSVAVGARDQAAAELSSNGGSIPRLTASMRNRLRFK
jgi:ABC-type transporter MlaC component